MKKIFILGLILLPTLGLLYFSLTRDPRSLPSALINRVAPPFELESLEGGQKISLQDMKGRPLVLSFWSTWCGPCVVEYRLLQEALRVYPPSEASFYMILYEDTVENARAFIERHGKGPPMLLDPQLRTAIDYGVSGVPETFFIDREGVVRGKHAGVLNPDVLQEKMSQMREIP